MTPTAAPQTNTAIQQSLASYRAGQTASPASTAAPAPAPAPQADPTSSAISQSLSTYRSTRDSGTAVPAAVKNNPSLLSSLVKGIFSAPATILARPVQAAASAVDYASKAPIVKGTQSQIDDLENQNADLVKQITAAKTTGADTSALMKKYQTNDQLVSSLKGVQAPALNGADIDTASSKVPIVGGLIAPTPKNAQDVVHDVGRAAQTVALGLSPLAGGALFGAGQAVTDQDVKDLASTQTLFDVALGAAGGKLLSVLGKPLISAAGKVIGTITPQVLKDVAAGGVDSIQKFAATHDLLGGIAAKPSAALAHGAQSIDDAIGTGASKLKGAVTAGFKSQYPNASLQQHYLDVNAKDLARPTTVNSATYSKASAVFNDAKNRGIDLAQVANERGIVHDDIASEGKYDTEDTVDQLRQANYDVGKQTLRPALKAISPDVARVPISQVRGALLKEIHDTPASQLNDADRAAQIKRVNTQYGDGSAADKAHPNGYALTDLYDSRIEAQGRGKYKPGITTEPNVLKAKLARSEGRVFKNLFDRNVPADSGLDAVRKESEKNFMLADYLDELDTKKVPEGITKKAVRLFGRGLGGVLGSKIGGFPGFLVGSRGGDMLFSSFETLPNPIKSSLLSNAFASRSTSPVFDTLNKYLGEKETARLLQKALPAAGGSSFKETSPTLFTTPKGVSTPIKSEAIDLTTVEKGNAKPPTTDRRLSSYLKKTSQAQSDAGAQYTPDNELPTIKADAPAEKQTLAQKLMANSNPADKIPQSTYEEYAKYPQKKINVDDIEGLDHRGLILSAETPGRKVTVPVLVDENPDGTYQLVDGNHRVTQAMVNGDQTIPALVKPDVPYPKSFKIPAKGSVEELAEKAEGWEPGMKQQFDHALSIKDAPAVKKLLPEVPEEYKTKFASDIKSILGK